MKKHEWTFSKYDKHGITKFSNFWKTKEETPKSLSSVKEGSNTTITGSEAFACDRRKQSFRSDESTSDGE